MQRGPVMSVSFYMVCNCRHYDFLNSMGNFIILFSEFIILNITFKMTRFFSENGDPSGG